MLTIKGDWLVKVGMFHFEPSSVTILLLYDSYICIKSLQYIGNKKKTLLHCTKNVRSLLALLTEGCFIFNCIVRLFYSSNVNKKYIISNCLNMWIVVLLPTRFDVICSLYTFMLYKINFICTWLQRVDILLSIKHMVSTHKLQFHIWHIACWGGGDLLCAYTFYHSACMVHFISISTNQPTSHCCYYCFFSFFCRI